MMLLFLDRGRFFGVEKVEPAAEGDSVPSESSEMEI